MSRDFSNGSPSAQVRDTRYKTNPRRLYVRVRNNQDSAVLLNQVLLTLIEYERF